MSADEPEVYQCDACPEMAGYRCMACKAAYYCSKSCQMDHWHTAHRQQCAESRIVASTLAIGMPLDAADQGHAIFARFTRKGRALEQQDQVVSTSPRTIDGSKVRLNGVIDGFGAITGARAAYIAYRELMSFAYNPARPEQTLRGALVSVDFALRADPAVVAEDAGVTCVLTMFIPASNELWIANVGDCQAWVMRDGRVRLRTAVHRWNHTSEYMRNIAAGDQCQLDEGKNPPEMVYHDDDGSQVRLGVSRALGPVRMRDCGVLPTADVVKWDVRPGHDRVILGSSGVWKQAMQEADVEALSEENQASPGDAYAFADRMSDLLTDLAIRKEAVIARVAGRQPPAEPFADNTTLLVGSFKRTPDMRFYAKGMAPPPEVAAAQ